MAGMEAAPEGLMGKLTGKIIASLLVCALPVTAADWQIALSLTDGARIIGAPATVGLPLLTTGVGRMQIPWERIRQIEWSADRQMATVTLLNRDQVRGAVEPGAWRVRTAFGTHTVPAAMVRKAQFRPAGARDVWWAVLPIAPADPESKPSSAATVVDEADVVLDGWQVRSQRTFARPVTFECDAVLTRAPNKEPQLGIRFVPADEPRDAAPSRCVALVIGQRRDGRQYMTVFRNGVPVSTLYEELGGLNVGEAYRLRVRWDDESFTVTLNDRTFVTKDVTAWYDSFHIDLYGGPGERWRVTECAVRP